MRYVSVFILLGVSVLMFGCSKPLHTGMSLAELTDQVNVTFQLGMTEPEAIHTMEQLKLDPRQDPKNGAPYIFASVPLKCMTSPLNWSRTTLGRLDLYLDQELRLANVSYTAPFAMQERNDGYWPDEPILLMGDEQ